MSALLRRLPPRWFFHDVLAPYFATRLLLCFVGMLTLELVVGPSHQHYKERLPVTWLDCWTRWDSAWYVSVAQLGYQIRPEGEYSNLAFMPLYPMMMRWAVRLAGGSAESHYYLAGIIISNLALLVALTYLTLLVRLDFDSETAARTTRYLLVFPATLFLSAVYTESVFLALVFGCFYHARRDQWWRAGLLGGMAALTKTVGVILVVPLAWEYCVQRRFDWRELRWNVLALSLIPACLWLHMFRLYQKFGDPVAFARTHSAWGRRFIPPWESLGEFLARDMRIHGSTHSILDLWFMIVFLVLVGWSWKATRSSYALFGTLGCLILISEPLMSITRCVLMLFPAFIVLARFGRVEWLHRTIMLLGTGMAVFFMVLFSAWRWVA